MGGPGSGRKSGNTSGGRNVGARYTSGPKKGKVKAPKKPNPMDEWRKKNPR